MQKPLFSIIIPVYNSECTLSVCLESILNQSCKDFEILITDDGSKDGSGEICDDYAKRDSRIRVVHQENSGVSNARNAALRMAVGRYVSFVDSDDRLNSDMLAQLAEYVRLYSECSLFFFGFQTEKNGTIIEKKSLGLGVFKDWGEILGAVYSLENRSLLGWTWNKLFRRDILHENKIIFDSGISHQEDYIFTLQYLQYVNSIVLLPIEPYNYNIASGSSLIHKLPPYNKFKVKEDKILKGKLDLLNKTKIKLKKVENIRYQRKSYVRYYSNFVHQLSEVISNYSTTAERKEYVFCLQQDIRDTPVKYLNYRYFPIYILAFLGHRTFFNVIVNLKRIYRQFSR